MTRGTNDTSGSQRNPSPFQLQLFPAVGEPTTAEPARKPAKDPRQPPEAPDGAGPPSAPRAVGSPAAGRTLAHRLRETLARVPGASQGRHLRSLTLTDNRSTIVSAREVGGSRLDVRIHRCFASAPDEILIAVATFLSSGKRSVARRRALAIIRAYFEGHRPVPLAGRRPRRIKLRPVGQTLDLREVRDDLNRQYFDGKLDVYITWGRAPSRRQRRGRRGFSVRLGTYGDHDKVVRIHRCLDRADVPRYVVESVVYHEMLHAAMPPEVKNGRRRIHTPEFRRQERRFPSYQRSERWLERNLKRLI